MRLLCENEDVSLSDDVLIKIEFLQPNAVRKHVFRVAKKGNNVPKIELLEFKSILVGIAFVSTALMS